VEFVWWTLFHFFSQLLDSDGIWHLTSVADSSFEIRELWNPESVAFLSFFLENSQKPKTDRASAKDSTKKHQTAAAESRQSSSSSRKAVSYYHDKYLLSSQCIIYYIYHIR
jgi:hypothetical protein